MLYKTQVDRRRYNEEKELHCKNAWRPPNLILSLQEIAVGNAAPRGGRGALRRHDRRYVSPVEVHFFLVCRLPAKSRPNIATLLEKVAIVHEISAT